MKLKIIENLPDDLIDSAVECICDGYALDNPLTKALQQPDNIVRDQVRIDIKNTYKYCVLIIDEELNKVISTVFYDDLNKYRPKIQQKVLSKESKVKNDLRNFLLQPLFDQHLPDGQIAYLTYLSVHPQYRNQHIGSVLFIEMSIRCQKHFKYFTSMVVSPTIKHMFNKFNHILNVYLDGRRDVKVDHITMEGVNVLKGLVYDVYLIDIAEALKRWNKLSKEVQNLILGLKEQAKL